MYEILNVPAPSTHDGVEIIAIVCVNESPGASRIGMVGAAGPIKIPPVVPDDVLISTVTEFKGAVPVLVIV